MPHTRSLHRYLKFHFFYDLLRVIGMRDRLRCPNCKAVGTWKPHGGVLDSSDTRKVVRWLCKWCGLYIGPEGVKLCGVGKLYWQLPEELELKKVSTPRDAVFEAFGRPVYPWKG